MTADGRITASVSLCAGIGGLDLAVGRAPDVVAETDPHCSALLAARFPTAPNVGDWTMLDRLEDLPCGSDIGLIAAGLPCQPVSSAGRRQGRSDPRWLWDSLADLIARSDIRPLLLLENVADIASARHAPALDAWRQRIAAAGYRITETVCAASDAGAPHRRRRWFALCDHPDSPDPQHLRPDAMAVADTDGAPSRGPLLPTCTAADAKRGPDAKGVASSQTSLGNALLPTSTAQDSAGVASSGTLPGRLLGGPPCRPSSGIADSAGRIGRHGWQQYQPAVDHWAEVIGRPPPTQVQARSHDRLLRLICPELPEWIMGLPHGWATGILDTRPALRALGNAVCPAQGRVAVSRLLSDLRRPAQARIGYAA